MASSQQLTSIDMKTTSGLTEILKMLESSARGGLMDVDQVWNDHFPTPLCGTMKADRGATDSKMLLPAELKSSLEELRHLLDALDCLTSSLKRKISSLDAVRKSLVLSHWANTTPVEILGKIFEEVCLGNRRAALNLAHVNKRFHNIVMHNPCLWNNISNIDTHDSYGELLVSLQRSKGVSLNVGLDFHCKPVDSVKLLGSASLEAFRWEDVVYLTEYSRNWKSLLHEISHCSTELNLPRLRSATIQYPQVSDIDGRDLHDINYSGPLVHFYASWFVPKLTELKVSNLFPRPFLHLAPPLTTLELFIDERNAEIVSESGVYDMNLLLEFLRSCPLLETLRLDFYVFKPSTRHDMRSLPATVLQNVQTFSFNIFNVDSHDLLPFMKVLRFPLLRELHVDIGSDNWSSETQINEWFDCVLPLSREHYTNVEVFKCMLNFSLNDEDCCCPFDFPFMKLPNLCSLTLQTRRLYPNMDYRDAHMKLPKLKEINFTSCYFMDLTPLQLLREALEEQDKWDALKEVTFTECTGLREMEDDEDLFWGKLVRFYDDSDFQFPSALYWSAQLAH